MAGIVTTCQNSTVSVTPTSATSTLQLCPSDYVVILPDLGLNLSSIEFFDFTQGWPQRILKR